MKKLSMLLLTMGMISGDIALGRETDKCAPHTIHREIFAGESSTEVSAAMRTKVILSAKWEDTRILAAFGLGNAMVGRDTVRGVDGSQVSYHAGKIRVNIVRSASTGLVITVSDGRYRGAWLVEPCDHR